MFFPQALTHSNLQRASLLPLLATMNTTRRRRLVDARDSLSLESDDSWEKEGTPTPHPSYPPHLSPLREIKREEDDEGDEDMGMF